jgi:hypothetical protein
MFNNAISFNPATNYQRGFQDPVSPVAEGISAFHNDLRVLVRFILGFVVYALYYCLTTFAKDISETNALTAHHLENLEGRKPQEKS